MPSRLVVTDGHTDDGELAVVIVPIEHDDLVAFGITLAQAEQLAADLTRTIAVAKGRPN
jgi:hypothetical protein